METWKYWKRNVGADIYPVQATGPSAFFYLEKKTMLKWNKWHSFLAKEIIM